MPNFELHADYNRDGIINLNSAEYNLRNQLPGAILIPNLDIERRRLSSRPSAGPLPALDFTRFQSLQIDDDSYNLVIKVIQPLPSAQTCYLRCHRIFQARINIYDTAGHRLTTRPGFDNYFVLPPLDQTREYRFIINIKTIPGGLFDRTSSVNTNFNNRYIDESRFLLALVSISSIGVDMVHDTGQFTIAPFLLMDSNLPVRKLYISNASWNTPTTTEVRDTVRPWSLPLIEVPVSLTDNDVWHQDQFQHAYLQGAGQNMQELIVHLPRMRTNNFSFQSRSRNLASFVNNYFPSDDIGIFTEFWNRNFEVRTVSGSPFLLNFRDTKELNANLYEVINLINKINTEASGLSRTWVKYIVTNWYDCRLDILDLINRYARFVDRLIASRPSPVTQAVGSRMIRRIRNRYTIINRTSRIILGRGIEIIIGTSRGILDRTNINKIFAKYTQIHSSSNYGGNIESTPPVANAPLGKIIIGSTTLRNGSEFMDPDLLKLFSYQRKQPIIEINTTWLRVGHVDEVVSIIPVRPASTNFSVFNASPRIALLLLQNIATLYISGLPANHPLRTTRNRFFRNTLDSRITMSGNHPVTRMFRGHAWEQNDNTSDLPKIFIQLALAYQGITVIGDQPAAGNASNIGLVPDEDDVLYPADISVLDALYAEEDDNNLSCNEFIDRTFVAPIRNQLQRDLPGKNIYQIPVLFDRVHTTSDWNANREEYKVSAFSPDMANLQYVNGHLLIPRPYGPRMLTADAIQIVRETLISVGLSSAARRIGQTLIARYALHRGIYWVEKCEQLELTDDRGNVIGRYGGIKTQDDVIELFKDSFPSATPAQLRQQIINPNIRNFSRARILRNRVNRFVIIDQMIDIFELYTSAICEEAQVTPHFIDTWSYHVGEGQIHCGTNVLRNTRARTGLPDFWNVRDHRFR